MAKKSAKKNKRAKPARAATAAPKPGKAAHGAFPLGKADLATMSPLGLGWDLIFGAAAAVLTLVLYAFSLSSNVLLEDDGLFIAVGETLGTAHPPGYPLFTILLWLFAQLPFASLALSAHFLSALLGALGTWALFLCAREIGLRPLVAALCALLFSLHFLVWSQAVRAEVYSLNYLLTFAALALALRIHRTPSRGLLWVLGGIVAGLGVANHWPLFVLAGPGLAVLLLSTQVKPARPIVVASGLFIALLVLAYGWLMLRSQVGGLAQHSGPILSLGELAAYFNRKTFSDVDTSQSATWIDRLQFFGWFGWRSLIGFTLIGGPLSLYGAFGLWQRARLVAAALLAVWASQSFLLLLLLNFDFEPLQVGVFQVYSLVSYGIQALFIGFGLQTLAERFGPKLPLPTLSRVLAPLGLSILAIWLGTANFGTVRQAEAGLAGTYLNYVNQRAPTDSLLITHATVLASALLYGEVSAEIRTDLDAVSQSGVLMPQLGVEGVIRQAPGFVDPIVEIQRRIAEDLRPIVFMQYDAAVALCPDCGTDYEGFLTRVVPGAAARRAVAWDEDVDQVYLETLLDAEPTIPWALSARKEQLIQFGRLVGRARLTNLALPDRAIQAFDDGRARPWAHIGAAREGLQFWDPAHADQVQAWLQLAEEDLPTIQRSSADYGQFLLIQGAFHLFTQNLTEARRLFEHSLEVWPDQDNAASALLQGL